MINAKRIYQAMIGLIILLCLLMFGATFFSDKLLQAQSKKLLEAKLENSVLENQQTALTQAKSDLKKYEELNALAKQIVPSDKDQAKTIREIISIADESGVSIATIGFPASDLGSQRTAAAASAGGPKVNTSSISQAKPVTGIEGLLQLDINVVSDSTQPSTYSQLISFLEKLENNRRTSHVTALSIQPNAQNNSLLSFSLTVTVYIKP